MADSPTSPGSELPRRPDRARHRPRQIPLAAALVLVVVGIACAGLARTGSHHHSPLRASGAGPRVAVPTALAASRAQPVVYIQAGHQPPGEPGYLAQTGASAGPFGTEVAFNIRLAAALEAKLRGAGVLVHHTAARVNPWGAQGAVFISLHFDAVGGSAGIGYAVDEPGRGENFYHGQGAGAASPVPLP